MKPESKNKPFSSKNVWEEILSPLKFTSGRIVFRYRRHTGKGTKQWRLEYNFLTKKFICSAFLCPILIHTWRKASTNKTERKILKEKMIRAIRRQLKRMRETEI